MSRDYGHAIRVLRAARGMTQRDLARRVGYTAAAISHVEAGDRGAGRIAAETAEALGVTPLLVDALASDRAELARLNAETRTAIALELLEVLATRRAT